MKMICQSNNRHQWDVRIGSLESHRSACDDLLLRSSYSSSAPPTFFSGVFSVDRSGRSLTHHRRLLSCASTWTSTPLNDATSFGVPLVVPRRSSHDRR
jgi:hypothetical protein